MGGLTDAFGLSDNAGQKRAAEQQAEAVRQQADATRRAANEATRASANKQAQEIARASATEKIAQDVQAVPDAPVEVTVGTGTPGETATRKRNAFQVSTPAASGSIRI